MTPTVTVRRRELLLIIGLFAATCWPLMSSLQTSNYVFDELNYHLPAVRQIASHWPALDLERDSLSATAPGYHYALATVSQITGDGMRRMRFINWAVSAALLAMIYVFIRKRLPATESMLLISPFAASNFFIKSACWVVTDNAALFLTAMSLFAALEYAAPAAKIRLSLASAAAVFVRQMAVWTTVLPFAAALKPGTPFDSSRRREILIALLLAVPGFIAVALLIHAWGGLVPPIWSETSVRLSTAGPIYLLSVLGIFGYLVLPDNTLHLLFQPAFRRTALIVFAVGMLFSLTSETSHSYEHGRWGGYLWSLAMRLPVVSGHSVLFALLCGLGALVVALLFKSLVVEGKKDVATVFLIGLAAWAATFVVNRQIFHRYFEPTVLIFLISFCSQLTTRDDEDGTWRWRLGGCGLLQLTATFVSAHGTVLIDG
jgi:hypothetical protein